MRASLRRGLTTAIALIGLESVAFAQPLPVPGESAAPATRPVAAASQSSMAAPPSGPAPPVAGPSSDPSAVAPAPSSSSPPPPSEPPSASAEAPPLLPTAASAVASAAAAPSASPEPSAGSSAAVAGAPVRLRADRIFSILVARGGRSAEERATAATAALARAAEDGLAASVRVEQIGDRASVLAGTRLIIELGPEDAIAASDTSLEFYAASVAARVREALEREQSRSVALMTLLSFLLMIICGVLGVFLIRKASDLADRTRAWIREHPDRLPAIKLQSIEVIRPESFRAALLIGLGAGKALAQIGVVYGWVLISLSLFESTRSYAERLTGFVFGPLYSILARLAGSLPLLVVAAIAAIAMVVLIRFVGLFFEGVTRGETTIDWLPADLAASTSLLVRATIVLIFFVIAAPLVTGDDGALARAGTVVVVALGLAAVPLLASVAVGVTVVYGRGLRVGDFAEVGGRKGKVSAITLLDVRLEDDQSFEVRVPHLLGLFHPTQVLGPTRLVSVEVLLTPKALVDDNVRDLLAESARSVGQKPRIEIVSLDAEAARCRVTVRSDALDAQSRLYMIVAKALAAADVPLGRWAGRAP